MIDVIDTALDAKELSIKVSQVVIFVVVGAKESLILLSAIRLRNLRRHQLLIKRRHALIRLPRRFSFIKSSIDTILLIAIAQICVVAMTTGAAVIDLLLLLARSRQIVSHAIDGPRHAQLISRIVGLIRWLTLTLSS